MDQARTRAKPCSRVPPGPGRVTAPPRVGRGTELTGGGGVVDPTGAALAGAVAGTAVRSEE
ncbi:hypothetical protein GCM10009642_51280 [Nocardiopsis metallicus]